MFEEKESFWKKKGFYLSACAAILCVLAIGTVYYKFNYQNNNGKNLFADSATTTPSSATSDIAGGSAITENDNDTSDNSDSEDAVSVAQNNIQENISDTQPESTPNSTPESDANSITDKQDTVDDSPKDNTSKKYVADANATKKTKNSKEDKDNKKIAQKQDKNKTDSSTSSSTNSDSKNVQSADDTVAAMTETGTKNKFDIEKGLLWPVTGDIILKYSMSNTVYFKTLAQYKCNPAIIIASEEGTNVKAAADGTVSKVTKSDETGNLVIVDIGSGYSVTYGQLDDISVKEGQSIKEGSSIGKIAKPTKYYSEEGSNLYLQVTENDKPVDPMLLLR